MSFCCSLRQNAAACRKATAPHRDSIERQAARKPVVIELGDARSYALGVAIGMETHDPQWSRLRAIKSKIEAARG